MATKYDWHDGHGRVHSRPKITTQGAVDGKSTASGDPSWNHPAGPATFTQTNGPPPPDPGIAAWYKGDLGNLDAGLKNTLGKTEFGVSQGETDSGFHAGRASHHLEFPTATGDQHGYDYTDYSFDPNGYKIGGVVDIDKATFDPSNPFTKMGMLQQAYEGAKRGTTNSYASQGQLYSGAVGRKRTSDHTNASGAFSSLVNAFAALIGGSNTDVNSALGTYRSGVGTLGGQFIDKSRGAA